MQGLSKPTPAPKGLACHRSLTGGGRFAIDIPRVIKALRTPEQGSWAARHPLASRALRGAAVLYIVALGTYALYDLSRQETDSTYGSRKVANAITLEEMADNPALLQLVDTTKSIHFNPESNSSESTDVLMNVGEGFLNFSYHTVPSGLTLERLLFIDMFDETAASNVKAYLNSQGIQYSDFPGFSVVNGKSAVSVIRIGASDFAKHDRKLVQIMGLKADEYERIRPDLVPRLDLELKVLRWEDFRPVLSQEGRGAGRFVITYEDPSTKKPYFVLDSMLGSEVDGEFQDMFLSGMAGLGYFSQAGDEWEPTGKFYSTIEQQPKRLIEDTVRAVENNVDYDMKKVDALHFFFPDKIQLREKPEIQDKEAAGRYLAENYPSRISVAFNKRIAVCRDYTLDTVVGWRILQRLDPRLLGITMLYASDDNMNHAWVAIKSGGTVTYIDPTWDDSDGKPLGGNSVTDLSAVDKHHTFSRLAEGGK